MWRRAVTTAGLIYFVLIHTRPTVAKEPCPELYRTFREARKVLILFKRIRKGKALTVRTQTYEMRCADDEITLSQNFTFLPLKPLREGCMCMSTQVLNEYSSTHEYS